MATLTDADTIATAAAGLSDCKLTIVDPIGSFLGGGIDAHRDNEVRAVLAPIAAMAGKHGIAVLIVAHHRKGAADHADDLAMGSRAFTGIARAVWHLSRDPENRSRRLLLPGKSNLAREGHGLAFTIIGDPPRLAWERDPVAMSADNAMGNQFDQQRPGPDAKESEEAAAWLKSALSDGPRLARELDDEWRNGQGGSKRTLDRAKKWLRVESFRADTTGPWLWRMPQDAKFEQLGELGNVGAELGNVGQNAALQAQDAQIAKFVEPRGELGNVGNDPDDLRHYGPYRHGL